MNTTYEVRYASHPEDFKHYTTEKIRKEFLIPDLFSADVVKWVYSLYDRYLVGGVIPVNRINLETIDPLKAPFFLERRELGVINVGGTARITADGSVYEVKYKEALYLGAGNKDVVFESIDKNAPAYLYMNSAPAHKSFPNKKVTLADAIVAEPGSMEMANARKINKLIVSGVVDTCQLQMGMTELKPGSVWNTMPPHTHDRRMEAYFYFEVTEKQAICHFMGKTDETRHIWMQNREAVLSPSWSIHSAAGTTNYTFIWGMAGENMDYSDMDSVEANQLK
ncbi:MAG TPA: 5-dehydro-4-deoxy-D-glucuronate isomerase [Bacteroidales bacterium]|nr:5-dehydro-4-deoxy-D-glucuronate isomerase [Bacteroidales bacterium]